MTGGLSDLISGRAITCVFMMYMAVPTVSTVYTNNNIYTIFIEMDNKNGIDCNTSASSSTIHYYIVYIIVLYGSFTDTYVTVLVKLPYNTIKYCTY